MAGSKRERPEGSGNWELKAYAGIDPVTGKKRWEYSRFHGKSRAAQHALDAFVAKVRAQRAPATEGTVGHLLAHWMRTVERDRSVTTADEYWRIIDTLWMPRLGDVKLAKLTLSDIQLVVDSEAARVIEKGRGKGQKVSPETVERQFAVLRRALNEAVRMGWIPHSPADHVVLPGKQYREERDPPSVDELASILAAADQLGEERNATALGMILRIAAATGLRRGELCGLRWRDIDLERGRIMVRKNAVVKKNRQRAAGEETTRRARTIVLKDTKTHQKRPVSIDAATVVLFRDLRLRCEAAAALAARDGKLAKDAFVFSRSADGSEPIRPPWITDTFKAAAVRAGVPDTNLHQLRHMNASLQLTLGVPLAVVSKRLGHRNQTTTLNIYSHVIDGDHAAAEVLGTALGGVLGQAEPQQPAAEVIPLDERRTEEAG